MCKCQYNQGKGTGADILSADVREGKITVATRAMRMAWQVSTASMCH